MTFGYHLKPKVDDRGRVHYSRDTIILGILMVIPPVAAICMLLVFHDAILSLGWSGKRPRGGYLGFVLLLAMLPLAIHMLLQRQRLILDPMTKTVMYVRTGLWGRKRVECKYGDVVVSLLPVIQHGRIGNTWWRGFGLYVGLPGGRVLISRSRKLDEIETIARMFSQLTGLPWSSSKKEQELDAMDS
jgi:hypothetical protein